MDQVSGIHKARGAVRVNFMYGASLLVPSPLFSMRPLKVGEDVEPDGYRQWLGQNEYAYALARAVRYLVTRERSRLEVRTYLTSAGYSTEAAGRVTDYLIQRGLLNDSRLAGQYVQSRSARAGSVLIARELKRKGIDEKTAANAVATLDEDIQAENAARFAVRYAARKNCGDPRTLGRRMIGMLMRRGYTFAQSSQAVRKVLPDWTDINDADE